MNRYLLLAVPLFIVVLMSGCTTEIPLSVAIQVSDNMTQRSFDFWDSFITLSNKGGPVIGNDEKNFFEDNGLCPLYPYDYDED